MLPKEGVPNDADELQTRTRASERADSSAGAFGYALRAGLLGVDPASVRAEDDIFEKLHIDSFQAVELMSELELEFDVEIPDYELQGVRTFGALARAIDKRR